MYRTGMLLIGLAAVAGLAAAPQDAKEQEPSAPPTATQPTTRPRPPQAEIYRRLLEEHERPARVQPAEPIRPVGAAPQDEQASMLLPEGTMLIDRAGRIVRSEGRSIFRFVGGSEEGLPAMELLPNGLLEAMEREAEAGVTQFYITALVTRYRGENYLFIQKYRRQVSHGNIGP